MARETSSPVQAALVFLPQGVLFTVASMFGGRLVARYGATVMMGGGGLAIAGLALMAGELATAGGHLASWWLIAPLSLMGLGNGLLLPPLIGAALSRVEVAQAGAASGALTTAQQFANSLGVTLIGTVFFAVAGPGLGSADSAMEGLSVLYALIAACVVLVIRVTRRPA